MSNNGAPDSWESQADFISEQGAKDSDDVSAKFSTLNVNAVEFVPSFIKPSQATDDSETPTTPQKSESGSTKSVGSPVLNGCGDVGGESGDGGAASASPRVEEPPPVPPAAGSPASASPASGTPASGTPADGTPAVGTPDAPAPSATAGVIPVPTDVSPTADSWEAEADDALLTPEENNEPEDEEIEQQEDGEATKKIPKKKPPRVEDTCSKKEHVNVVFIGHVDAGKSTIGGQIMSLTGMVDKRTLEKYEREAREKSRESWYLSWALDTNQEERDKGKTVEVGRAYFETDKKHFTILDAPGHKSFVPNMIGGAAQADLAVLVISARKGEFETGFDRGGQTREHAMLAKTAGVKHLVALVNKMDDPTVNWDEKRYNECRDKIMPYLKKLGFNPAKDLSFLPVSGQTGQGLLQKVTEEICPWYRGPSFIQLIDELPSLNRKMDGPFIMPVVDKYKDMGTVLMGKVEAGVTRKGAALFLMPNRVQVTVDQLWSDDIEVTSIGPGENVKVKLKGIEEEDVSPGFVLCDTAEPITTGRVFDAQVVILEHKSIICAGYSAVMHIHCAAEEITVKALICLVDKKTGEKSKTRPRFVKQDQVAIMRIECAGIICLEPFKKFAQMGRFTLRDENKTIAIGKVLKVIE
uniref:Tr-type G domain-containing protein n=1 Tax=Heliothis virescens TaxID=7102 RepID=A0A2A4JPB4_HELVI